MSLVETTLDVDEAKAAVVLEQLARSAHIVWTRRLPDGRRRIVYRYFDDDEPDTEVMRRS